MYLKPVFRQKSFSKQRKKAIVQHLWKDGIKPKRGKKQAIAKVHAIKNQRTKTFSDIISEMFPEIVKSNRKTTKNYDWSRERPKKKEINKKTLQYYRIWHIRQPIEKLFSQTMPIVQYLEGLERNSRQVVT